MKIKQGDIVIVTTGKDRGKSGTVLRVFPKIEKVLVEGVGMVKKHQRAAGRRQAGQIIDRPSPVHVSNVSIKDPKSGKATRVGYTIADGKKTRVAKASGNSI